MRVVIQRVSRADAALSAAPEEPISSINRGAVVLAAFQPKDTRINSEQMIKKIKDLRIFSDLDGKLNLSSAEVGAEFLLVSQFTLYAETKYGNRPSFSQAAPKPQAEEAFDFFVATAKRMIGESQIKSTPFGSDLQLSLTNDGPITLWLDSDLIL